MKKYLIQRAYLGVPTNVYQVENIPANTTDNELIDFCDPYCYDGDVSRRTSTTAIVRCYID